MFRTPGWGRDDRVLLRARDKGSEELLLHSLSRGPDSTAESQSSPSTPVFLFEPNSNNLREVTPDAWKGADTLVSECWPDNPGSLAPFSYDYRRYRLMVDGQPIASKGPYVFQHALSPSGRYLAFVSADGPFVEGGMFLGGTGAKGTHYHEVWSQADSAPLGEAVVLPWTTFERPGLSGPCWSTDERYVIYTDVVKKHLLVIPIHLQQGE